ncbi:MAG: iron-containing alcohol dehydrogenase [Lachnospiraceae bacterium]|nr:iron-containing alcohol dehydrogenase [Lachnospiraceae bacterium]
MDNFEFYLPTKVIFGKDTASETGRLAKEAGCKKVFIVYGSDRVKKDGLLNTVEKSLIENGISYEEFGGVKPNPLLSHAELGVKKARDFGADLILGVGGGSVIDTAKGIAHGLANPDVSLWDFWTKKASVERSTPVGAVLTIPAAGSEMSDSAVLTNEETGEKYGVNSPFNRCIFAVEDPSLAKTLPEWQIKNGIVDIMMHTMERYFISGVTADLTDRIAEGVIKTTRDSGLKVLNDPEDYDAMADLWWCSSLSHNNLTECGRGKDFSVHKIGMALSAFYDYTHGATLSAVWGSWARYLYKDCLDRFAKYARMVWDIKEDDDEKAALKGIEATEDFYRSIGMPASLHELGLTEPDDETLRKLAMHATINDTMKLSRIRPLTASDVVEIYKMAK